MKKIIEVLKSDKNAIFEVYIPSIKEILTNRVQPVKAFQEGKNTRYSFSIHEFINLIKNNNQIAYDILLATPEETIYENLVIWPEIKNRFMYRKPTNWDDVLYKIIRSYLIQNLLPG